MTFGGVMLARDLDGAFHRLGAGIGKKNKIRKALFAQPCRQPYAVRAHEQARHVPQSCALLLQRLDQMRMAMAERIHGDASSEIELALASGRGQTHALAALEPELGPS